MRLPIQHPRPDGEEFIRILMGNGVASRVPLVEYIVDDVVMRPIVTDLLRREWVPWGEDRSRRRRYLDTLIRFWYAMGYDFLRYEQSLPFTERTDVIPDAAPGSDKERAWPDEHRGAIMTRADFEAYRWPSVEEFDFSDFEYLNANLPEGVGLILSHGGGVFEHLSWIMSLEGLANALFEDPDLVREVANRLGELMVRFYKQILDFDRLIADVRATMG